MIPLSSTAGGVRPIRLAIGAALAIAVPALLVGERPSLADEPAQQSLVMVLGKGFKVVAIAFVPGEARTDKKPALVVTLQLDKTIAVCTFGTGFWETIASSGGAEAATAYDLKAGK